LIAAPNWTFGAAIMGGYVTAIALALCAYRG